MTPMSHSFTLAAKSNKEQNVFYTINLGLIDTNNCNFASICYFLNFLPILKAKIAQITQILALVW